MAEHEERQPLRFIERLEQRQREIPWEAERQLDAMIDERLDQRVCEFHRRRLPLEPRDQLVRIAVPCEVAIASLPDPRVQSLAP